MAGKKALPGAQSKATLLNQAAKQSTSRLTFEVTAEEHKAFQMEAIEHGKKMGAYFRDIWAFYNEHKDKV